MWDRTNAVGVEFGTCFQDVTMHHAGLGTTKRSCDYIYI